MPDAHNQEELDEWTTGWEDQIYNGEHENPDISLGEVLLLYFEWMSVHKVTDACAQAVYTIMITILPKDSNVSSWAKSKALLKKICDTRTQKIGNLPQRPHRLLRLSISQTVPLPALPPDVLPCLWCRPVAIRPERQAPCS